MHKMHKPPRSDFHVSKREDWAGQWRRFLIAVSISFVTVQVLFLAIMCLVYGSEYDTRNRIHNLKVLAVDYDGGVIGRSMSAAYQALKGDSFPTVQQESTTEYPTVESLQQAVCDFKYWAAIYTLPGASDRLAAAIQGGQAAATYNSSETIRFIWDEARYPTYNDPYILSNMQALIAASRTAYTKINGTRAFGSVDFTDPSAVNAFLNPITATNINLKPTTQGSKSLYTAVSIALAVVQQFFFLTAINGISAAMRLFSRLSAVTNYLVRFGISTLYTFIGSLCWAGYIWAFKETWTLNAGQFFLIWMNNWLFMQINFSVLDVLTAYVSMRFMPFGMIIYIMLNLASSLSLPETAPSFYKYGYAMPAHNWYLTFMTIITGGCGNRLYQSLPINFAWQIVFHLLIIPATLHRCRVAREAANKAQEKKPSPQTAQADEKKVENTASQSVTDVESVDIAAPVPPGDKVGPLEDRLDPLEEKPDTIYSPSVPVVFEEVGRASSRAE